MMEDTIGMINIQFCILRESLISCLLLLQLMIMRQQMVMAGFSMLQMLRRIVYYGVVKVKRIL